MAVITKIITKEVEVTDKLFCDNCSADIPLVFPDQEDSVQGYEMLHVELCGGYGEYVDGNSKIHLCKVCAGKLRKAFPLFEKVLRRTSVGCADWRNDEAWKTDDSLVDDVIQAKIDSGKN
jgi:hypothetical protein